MTSKNEKKILIGRSEIMNFIGISDPKLFYHFIDKGMPIRVINKRIYAHSENLEEYFKSITKTKTKNLPKDID